MKENSKIIEKQFVKSFWYILIVVITVGVGAFVDGIIIGRYMGTRYMGAYSLALPFYTIISIIGVVFSDGVDNQCAKAMGMGENEKVNSIFSSAVSASIFISIVLMVCSVIFINPIIKMLGVRGDVEYLFGDVKGYVWGTIIGIPFIILNATISAIMQLDNDRKICFLATLVTTVFDILLDLLNVYVVHLGMFGMALATSISYLISIFVLLLHFKGEKAAIRFELKLSNFKDTKEVIMIGLPTAITNISVTIRNVFFNFFLCFLVGESAVAAFSVKNTLSAFIALISVSVGITTLMLSGLVLGEKDSKSMKSLILVACKFTIIATGIIAVLLIVFAPFFVKVIIKDSSDVEVYNYAVRCLRLYGFSIPLYSIVYLFMSIMQGMKNKKMIYFICVMDNLVVIVLLSFLLGNKFGLDGVWIAFPLTEIIVLLIIFILSAIHVKRVPKHTLDFVFLHEKFGVDEKDVLQMSICDMNDIMSLSEKSVEFCRERKADEKRSMLVGLVIEEIAGNVVKHGLIDEKKHNIEIRLVKENDDIMVRIRDDCKEFNPKEYYDTIKNAKFDETSIGIKMVFSMVKECKYVNTLNLNNLIIVV